MRPLKEKVSITLDSDVTQTTIIVTAEDGTTEEYTINIHRNI